MFRTSPTIIVVISLAPFACTGTDPGGEETKTTSEASGTGTAHTSEGTGSTTAVSTSLPTTSETSNGDATQGDTGGDLSATTTEGGTTEDSTTEHSTTGDSTTAHSTTGDSTTEDSTETDGGSPFKVGLELKTLCRPTFEVMCGMTLDDRMVCWGDVEHPSFKVPPGKVKGISDRCSLAILDNGELHRVMDYPLKPVSLPKGPFVLAGGDHPYGCAMAANNEMTCWLAEGYEALEEPPPGPYLALGDPVDGACQMCGIKGDGSLVCWKKPLAGNGDWETNCGANPWGGVAAGTYTKFIDIGFDFARAMNSSGQLVWFTPNGGGSTYVQPLFAPGGFVEADTLVGLKDSGELLYFEKAMGDGVPVLPGAYVTFEGSQYNGCAIRQADSRVVCWGEGDYGQFDPPTE